MSIDLSSRSTLAAVAKWSGRALALLLFLFWGMFFLEHLKEWFLHWGGPYPPTRVWIAQLFHLMLVAGFALTFKWERLGSLAIVLGTAGFILSAGFHPIPWFFLLNLAPVACFAVREIVAKRQTAPEK